MASCKMKSVLVYNGIKFFYKNNIKKYISVWVGYYWWTIVRFRPHSSSSKQFVELWIFYMALFLVIWTATEGYVDAASQPWKHQGTPPQTAAEQWNGAMVCTSSHWI